MKKSLYKDDRKSLKFYKKFGDQIFAKKKKL